MSDKATDAAAAPVVDPALVKPKKKTVYEDEEDEISLGSEDSEDEEDEEDEEEDDYSEGDDSDDDEEELGTAALLGPLIPDDEGDQDFEADPNAEADDDDVIYEDEEDEEGGDDKEPSKKKAKISSE